MSPFVALRQVSKRFGEDVILAGLDLEFDEGEFIVIVGPSGCGKSTTLRIIAGLERVSGGAVFIGGKEVTGLPPKQRSIAMVFQSYALYPHMNVAQNMSFALRLARMAKDAIDERVGKAAQMLDIGNLLERKPRDLSGGQRQRVATGRAITRAASCFLFDEPLSNLDAKLRAQMRTELLLLHKRLAKTMIFVTHDQIEAMTMADRIVVMSDGEVQQVGTPRKVYNEPANLFVARFIGSPAMNVLDGELAEENGSLQVRGEGYAIAVPPELRARLKASAGSVKLGLRPEHFAALGDRVGTEGYEPVDIEVSVAEYIGASQYLTGRIGSTPVTTSVSAGVDESEAHSGRYWFDASRLYFFDPASGASLLADAHR